MTEKYRKREWWDNQGEECVVRVTVKEVNPAYVEELESPTKEMAEFIIDIQGEIFHDQYKEEYTQKIRDIVLKAEQYLKETR